MASLVEGVGTRQLVRCAFSYPWLTIGLWAMIVLVVAPGVGELSVETSTESVLDREGERWAFYEKSQRIFGGDEVVVAMIKSDQPYDPQVLQRVESITQRLEEVRGVRRVDSLSSVPLIRSKDDATVNLDPAIHGELPPSKRELDELVSRIRNDRIAPRFLVSENGRAFAINVLLERDGEEHYGRILRRIREELGTSDASVSGVPIFRRAADERTRQDLFRFLPLTVGAVALVLFLIFGNFRAVAIPLGSSGVASWIVLGVMGMVGRPLTISTVILPSILLALGCAYAVHLVTAAMENDGPLEDSLCDVSLPIALAGTTTAIGFVAVAFVRIEAVRDIGAFGAVGVVVVMVATLTGGVSALALWEVPRRRARLRRIFSVTASDWVVRIATDRRPAVFMLWAICGIAVAGGLFRLNVETDVVRWFPRGSEIRESYEDIRAELSGISPMNLVVEAPRGRRASEPEVIKALNELGAHLEKTRAVGKVITIADPLAEVHEAFGRGSSRSVPSEQRLIEQYLLLLQSKPQTADLISNGHESANVLMRVDDNGSDALLNVAYAAEEWWRAAGPPGFEAQTTGIMYEFARAENEIAIGQIRGLAFALLVMAVVLGAMFGFSRMIVLGLVPNVVPVVMVFGVMGIFGIPLDAGTVLIGNLAFGIAVDDTIHTLVAYERRRRLGCRRVGALRLGFRAVMPALVFTTAIVVLGFAVLGASSFLLTKRMGLLTAAVMLVCLVADVLLLPALLVGRRRKDTLSGPSPEGCRSAST